MSKKLASLGDYNMTNSTDRPLATNPYMQKMNTIILKHRPVPDPNSYNNSTMRSIDDFVSPANSLLNPQAYNVANSSDFTTSRFSTTANKVAQQRFTQQSPLNTSKQYRTLISSTDSKEMNMD